MNATVQLKRVPFLAYGRIYWWLLHRTWIRRKEDLTQNDTYDLLSDPAFGDVSSASAFVWMHPKADCENSFLSAISIFQMLLSCHVTEHQVSPAGFATKVMRNTTIDTLIRNRRTISLKISRTWVAVIAAKFHLYLTPAPIPAHDQITALCPQK